LVTIIKIVATIIVFKLGLKIRNVGANGHKRFILTIKFRNKINYSTDCVSVK
jgi:hypothetical protein